MKIFIGGIWAGKTGTVMTGTVTTPTRGPTRGQPARWITDRDEADTVMTGTVTTPTRGPTRGQPAR